jgi:hypothetical protein
METTMFLVHWLQIVDAVNISVLLKPKYHVYGAELHFKDALLLHPSRCMMPFRFMGFFADGRVSACCRDNISAENNMGNAQTDRIKAIWHSNLYRQYRKQVYPAGSPCWTCGCWKTEFKPAVSNQYGFQTLYSGLDKVVTKA